MLLNVLARPLGRRCRRLRTFSTEDSPRTRNNSSKCNYPEGDFKLRKALIVSKLSRFEFEQLRYPELNALELERRIRDRGTDYDSLISYNEQHGEFRRQVVECFKRNNVEVKVVDRSVIGHQWSQLIVINGK